MNRSTRKIALVASAAALLWVVPGVANAETNADSPTTTVASGTKARTTTRSLSEFRTRLLAWQEETREYMNSRKTILENFRDAVVSATQEARSALESATTKAQRQAIGQTLRAATAEARQERDAALAALGARPVRPTK
jgi:hypothetical protein